jgi:hypothetical protein
MNITDERWFTDEELFQVYALKSQFRMMPYVLTHTNVIQNVIEMWYLKKKTISYTLSYSI